KIKQKHGTVVLFLSSVCHCTKNGAIEKICDGNFFRLRRRDRKAAGIGSLAWPPPLVRLFEHLSDAEFNEELRRFGTR
ncbi:MAG: hypothetical protein ACK5WZ_06490, partial [Pseudobdellovibrionaceae bacterium]